MADGVYFLRRVEMYTRVLGLPISALVLAYGVVGATAQDRMTQQPDQQQMQSQPTGREDASTMGPGGMVGHGTMGGHMMGRGMMGGGAMGPPIMFRMMFALMDTDSDGTISLQEFQAAHDKIFKAMDSNKDGKLTLEEMQAFMHGTR
jgi:EF hand